MYFYISIFGKCLLIDHCISVLFTKELFLVYLLNWLPQEVLF